MLCHLNNEVTRNWKYAFLPVLLHRAGSLKIDAYSSELNKMIIPFAPKTKVLYELIFCLLLLLGPAELHGQDRGYIFNNDQELIKVSLETGEILARQDLAYEYENERVFSVVASRDPQIYVLTRAILGGNERWFMYEYDIANDVLTSLGQIDTFTVPSGFGFDMDGVIDERNLLIEMPKMGATSITYDYYAFDIVDFSLSFLASRPSLQSSADSGNRTTFENPVDETTWYWNLDGTPILYQITPAADVTNGPVMVYNDTFDYENSAFDSRGQLFATKPKGDGTSLIKFNFETGESTDFASIEAGTGARLAIFTPQVSDTQFLHVSSPTIVLEQLATIPSTIEWPFRIVNNGSEPLTINGMTTATTAFSTDFSGSLTLQPGGSNTVTVSYAANGPAAVLDTLDISLESSGLYQRIPLRGQTDELPVLAELEKMPEGVLVAEFIRELATVTEDFQRMTTLTQSCTNCRHEVAPNGLLYRLTPDGVLGLFDAEQGSFVDIGTLPVPFQNAVSFTVGESNEVYVLERFRFADAFSGTARIQFRVFVYDYIARRRIFGNLIYEFDESQRNDQYLQQIKYDPSRKELLALAHNEAALNEQTSTIRIYTSDLVGLNNAIIDNGRFESFYQDADGSFVGSIGNSVFDMLTESRATTSRGTFENGYSRIVGLWSSQRKSTFARELAVYFPWVELGESANRNINFINQESVPAVVTIDGIDGDDFTLLNDGAITLQPGESGFISFSFSPDEPGLRSGVANISVDYGGESKTERIGLFGTGTGIVTSVEDPELLRRTVVYPNPVSTNEVTIGGLHPEVAAIQLINPQGAAIGAVETNGEPEVKMHVPGSNGLYILHFITQTGEFLGSRKLIIQR